MIQTPEAAFLVMLGGAICLSSLPLRRQMAFPLGALALAIAGLRAGSGTSHLLSRETLANLPAGFRAVTAGLVLLGIIGAVVVAIRAHRSGFWLGPGIILGAGSVRDILAAAPIGLSLLAGMIIVLLAAIGRSDGSRASIVDELTHGRVPGTVIGGVSFDANGDPTRDPVSIYRISKMSRPTPHIPVSGLRLDRVIEADPALAEP